MRTSLRAGAVAALLLTVGLSACGTSSGDDASKDATTTVATTAPDDDGTTTAPDNDGTTTAPDDGTTTAPDDDTSTTVGSGDDDICTPLQAISDYDSETAAALAEDKPWSELQEIFINDTEDVLDAYDEAIALADDEVADDLQTLRDFTAPTADLAREATSLVDLGTKLSSQDGLVEAGQAGQSLDTYARATCGFGTSTAGN